MERWQSIESVGVFELLLLPLGQQENCSSGSAIEYIIPWFLKKFLITKVAIKLNLKLNNDLLTSSMHHLGNGNVM